VSRKSKAKKMKSKRKRNERRERERERESNCIMQLIVDIIITTRNGYYFSRLELRLQAPREIIEDYASYFITLHKTNLERV
jgi:hypothetical protein